MPHSMEKELVRLFEAAKKAADAAAVAQSNDGGAEESRCVDALRHLKKFPVTYQILVSTQIGKRLRQLSKHPKKKIQNCACELIEMWKYIIINESDKNKKIRDNTNIKVGKFVKEAKKLSLENLKSKDAARDKIREFLFDAFSKVPVEAALDQHVIDKVNATDPIRVAVSVESAMFENWGASNGTQKVKYRSIVFNLKDPKNPDFRRRVLLGLIKPEELIDMSTFDMASDERKRKNEEIAQKAMIKCERGRDWKASLINSSAIDVVNAKRPTITCRLKVQTNI